jgi:hypothetical protein
VSLSNEPPNAYTRSAERDQVPGRARTTSFEGDECKTRQTPIHGLSQHSVLPEDVNALGSTAAPEHSVHWLALLWPRSQS